MNGKKSAEPRRRSARGGPPRRKYRSSKSREGKKPRKPRLELHGKEYHVFVSMPYRFADDIIRGDYVQPVIDKLTMDRAKSVVYKARGRAINAAVRAALLLEETMGVMKKNIKISSMVKPQDRIISSMEITMSRF